jgi:predicted small metal-binding protein
MPPLPEENRRLGPSVAMKPINPMRWHVRMVIDMVAVRCPACDQPIRGEDPDDLTENVKAHFMDMHDLESMISGRAPSNRPEAEERKAPGTSRPLYGEPPRKESDIAPGSERSPPMEPSRPVPGGGGPHGRIDRRERPFGGPSGLGMPPMGPLTGAIVEQGTAATKGLSGFDCPLCQEFIGGSDEEELTASFRDHLTSVHGNEPFVTKMVMKEKGR